MRFKALENAPLDIMYVKEQRANVFIFYKNTFVKS